MNPATLIALIAAATELLQTVIPLLSKLVAGGEASAADQGKVKAALEKLRETLDGDLPDHWRVD